jgi:hypothetical protein
LSRLERRMADNAGIRRIEYSFRQCSNRDKLGISSLLPLSYQTYQPMTEPRLYRLIETILCEPVLLVLYAVYAAVSPLLLLLSLFLWFYVWLS